MKIDALPFGLDDAVSCEDGVRLLDRACDEVTPEVVLWLLAAADGADDPAASADLGTWADRARALLAWSTLLAEPPADVDDARRRIVAAAC